MSFTGDKAQGGRLLVSAGRVSTPWAPRQIDVLLLLLLHLHVLAIETTAAARRRGTCRFLADAGIEPGFKEKET